VGEKVISTFLAVLVHFPNEYHNQVLTRDYEARLAEPKVWRSKSTDGSRQRWLSMSTLSRGVSELFIPALLESYTQGLCPILWYHFIDILLLQMTTISDLEDGCHPGNENF
jgi:hypothetical protein